MVLFNDADLTSLEICAGAGGQALGLERAGFRHVALVEIDGWARKTLLYNRPYWPVINQDGPRGISYDVTRFSAKPFKGVDLLSGGVPCPPFSVAGHKRGSSDERDLFPHALRLVRECEPKAVMIENVRGLLSPEFDDYRGQINWQLECMGYRPHWKLLNACDFGVPQLRPRAILVALREDIDGDGTAFQWPEGLGQPPTAGEALFEEMASRGWELAEHWAKLANDIAPTLVGGSRKHGGPDLGPTRARAAWARLGVDGRSLADEPPGPGFTGMPRLTVRMAAILQGFPPSWVFLGPKTPAYRQVGNAFPPPVAEAVARQIRAAIAASACHQLAGVA